MIPEGKRMITIYSHKRSKRFQYILELFFNDLIGTEFVLTTDKEEYTNAEGAKLQYTQSPIDDHPFIYAEKLLFETHIQHQEIRTVIYNDVPCIFPTYIDESLFPFDVFSAAFYLISRYEEYLPHKRDHYNRFSAKESISHQLDFLHLPVINIWAKDLLSKITDRYPDFKATPKKYQFTPTYDIDNAWAYKNKGITRFIGGTLRSVFNLDTKSLKDRFKVVFGNKPDPYDTYQMQKRWQSEYQLNPIYFILFGELGPFDKNISTLNLKFQDLIKGIRDHALVGIHPTYRSNEDVKVLKKEITNLSETIHVDIIRSRQHFLKLMLPQTYRNLLNLGINHDYTMGYADRVGFRAGITSAFYFYDLDLETKTKLIVHPFAIMDGSLRDYLKVGPTTAKNIISNIIKEVKEVDGEMISIWHNESLSNKERWKDWQEVYIHLLKEAKISD